MRLSTVTITGADQGVEPRDLLELSNCFPFVEWGILFSKSKQGLDRYPTDAWINDFLYNYVGGVKVSAHLCGGWVRDLVETDWSFVRRQPSFVNCVSRIQLNMSDDVFMALNFHEIKERITDSGFCPRVIIQTKREFERFESLRDINAEGEIKFDMLFDVSGGTGKLPNGWCVPADGVFCGYAGGLGPETLEEQLPMIANAIGDVECWIDMESGVRDENNCFDLDKVEKCLEIAKHWVV